MVGDSNQPSTPKWRVGDPRIEQTNQENEKDRLLIQLYQSGVDDEDKLGEDRSIYLKVFTIVGISWMIFVSGVIIFN